MNVLLNDHAELSFMYCFFVYCTISSTQDSEKKGIDAALYESLFADEVVDKFSKDVPMGSVETTVAVENNMDMIDEQIDTDDVSLNMLVLL